MLVVKERTLKKNLRKTITFPPKNNKALNYLNYCKLSKISFSGSEYLKVISKERKSSWKLTEVTKRSTYDRLPSELWLNYHTGHVIRTHFIMVACACTAVSLG